MISTSAVVVWFVALSIGPSGGGTAAKASPASGSGKPVARWMTAEVNIILPLSRDNPEFPGRLSSKHYPERQIFVSGDVNLDGKTFRHGIKGSFETQGEPNESWSAMTLSAGGAGVVVAKYHFEREDIPGTGGGGRRPATRWVGHSVTTVILSKDPANIDEIHSGSAESIPAVR